MIDPSDLRDYVIVPALSLLSGYDERMAGQAPVSLLLGTVAHESLGGKYLHQIGGPALGIYQIEPGTHADVWDSYIVYRPNLVSIMTRVRDGGDEQLIYDLRYATMIARLIYWRAPEPLPAPDDAEGMARYWKAHYNTSEGAGTVEEWMSSFQSMRGDL